MVLLSGSRQGKAISGPGNCHKKYGAYRGLSAGSGNITTGALITESPFCIIAKFSI
jgi:hypothetical protein